MGIGAGIVLVAIGAILTFAVKANVAGVDIHVVGIILMAAGAAGILLDLLLFLPRRRRTTVVSQTTAYPASASQPVQGTGRDETI